MNMAVTPINRTMEDCDKYVQAQSMSRRWSALGPACIAALRNPTWFERTTVGAVGVNICRMGTRLAVVMLVCESSHERNRKTIRDSGPAELD